MNLSLEALWLRIVRSFWLIPASLAIVAIGAAICLNAIDHVFSFNNVDKLAWFAQTPEGARTMLSTITGSMVTVLGVLLSTMVVVLTLASQQYGPRLVKNFIEDRPSQFVIGVFAGAFIYNVITLKNVSASDSDFVPNISILFAVLFTLLCIGLMIFFVQHIASAIQVQSIMRRVYHDLNQTVDSLFPEQQTDRDVREITHAEALEQMSEGADDLLVELRCPSAGYLQLVRDEELVRLAKQYDLRVELLSLPGEFLYEAEPMARLRIKRTLHDEAREDLMYAFVVGKFPTHEQDVLFPIRQMEEIAVRALSPGVNDPHTALECIDYFTCAFRRLSQRDWPTGLLYDEDGEWRVVAEFWDYEKLLRSAFEQIFFYGRQDITIVRKILLALNDIADSCAPRSKRQQVAAALAQELSDAGAESLPLASQRDQLPNVGEHSAN